MTSDPVRRHAKQAGFGEVPSDLIFDAERDRPRIVDAVERLCPNIRQVMAGLRQRLPIASNATEGVTGQFYRLPGHYRSLCCTIPDLADLDDLWEGDVITFKGTEPLLADFDDYLDWMMTARFRGSDLPIGLHFPLVVNVPPGAVPLDECDREQRMAAAVHERHLSVYGELAQAPVPLAVHRCSRHDTTRYVDTLRRHLPPQAFERIETRANAGCGVTVSYYPTAPIRVDDLRVLSATTPGIGVAAAEGEDTVTAWCRLFARLLHLGYMPFAPWNKGRGSCVDAGNACIDGGFADLLMLVPFESIPDDRWFRLSLLASVTMLRHTIVVFAASLGGAPPTQEYPMLEPLTRVFLQPRLLEQIEAENPTTQRPDARILSCFRLDALDALVAATTAETPRGGPYNPGTAP
jgi:hypothetical protein